jgi:predicted nucleic acid-binding protein
VIYLDSSVALAHLLTEDRKAPESIWRQTIVSSRLLEYEVWNRIHSLNLASTLSEQARALMGRLGFIELAPPVLARALEPFPIPVRTLDALHLASMEYLGRLRQTIALASFDHRLLSAARALGMPIFEL